MSTITPLIDVAAAYRHTGRLIYYESTETQVPFILEDTGPAGEQTVVKSQGNASSGNNGDFNHYDFDSYSIPDGMKINTLLEAHSHFPSAFAPYISVGKGDEKQ